MAQVTFVHGIMNKLSPDAEIQVWKSALSAGPHPLDLDKAGIRTSAVYWADMLYGSPLERSAKNPANDLSEELRLDPDLHIEDLRVTGPHLSEQDWVLRLAGKLGAGARIGDDSDLAPPEYDADGSLERVPLPWTVKERFLKSFLRDVHHYLFNEEFSPRPGVSFKIQDEIRQRFVDNLRQAADQPRVVVCHSMGTVIAYDCLKRVPECPEVDALLTIGSPLGIDEIQDKLQPEWTRAEGFPEKIRNKWFNVFDHLDPVAAFDPFLSSDFRKGGSEVIVDIHEPNSGLWRHDLSKYLQGPKLRSALREALEI